jgi:UPF0271 protein
MKLDLNCDLGEGEPPARTRELMRHITSANVACGGHAGDVASMTRCVLLAKQCGVKLGAHPSLWSRGDFGRGEACLTPEEFELLLLQQVGTLDLIARARGVRLHHVKLHGALYHVTERNSVLRHAYLAALRSYWPGLRAYSLAGGAVFQDAKRARVEVWQETFADRAYRDDGKLVPRVEPGAILTDEGEVMQRVKAVVRSGTVKSISGRPIAIAAQTLCVHSDTPNAVRLVRAIASLLR